MTPQEREQVDKLLAPLLSNEIWPPSPFLYKNTDSKKFYKPHHAAEMQWINDGANRYLIALGGEGGGKSVAGIIRTLERLKGGNDGIMVSPDLPHFKKSLWSEFRRWCPWQMVTSEHQYKQADTWQPSGSFPLVFKNGATLWCGGIESPIAWEGLNVNFAHLDEARRLKDAGALKVLDGRVRIVGKGGELPQIWITTTPRKNWLFEYFGDLVENDIRKAFKQKSHLVRLLTDDNKDNLAHGYAEDRRLSLTEAEARVLLEAQWEDVDNGQRFIPSVLLWDNCQTELKQLSSQEPLVMALDAGVSNDSFAIVAVSKYSKDTVAVRIVHEFKPQGSKLDFGQIEAVIKQYCKQYNIVQITYDEYQLHDMASRLQREGLVWVKPFPQGGQRLESDKQLFDLILSKRVLHNGDKVLRSHIDNADRKIDADGRKFRLVKREGSLKIDLAVALSMASYECLRLNL